MTRDECTRKLCDTPADYDTVIDFIRDNNPTLKNRGLTIGEREDFAINVVHACIRDVLFTMNGSSYCSTGGCIAIRASMDPRKSGYDKVILAVQTILLKQ